MSIADQITRLQGVKSDILSSIESKGVDVPSGAMLDDCPSLIDAISGGGDVSFSMKPIVPVSGNKFIICDSNGNIGYKSLPVYVPSAYTSYAVVVEGASFSDFGLGQVTIITPGASDIGGRTYRTVTINGVTWLAENLDYKASEIDIGPDGKPSTPAAWYYDNNESTYGLFGNKYGLLYNWHAVKHLNDNRATLMPGWHVPTIDECDSLMAAVGGVTVAGTKLKSTTGWSSGNGTDDFGFSAFPAGARVTSSFSGVGSYAYFWTISEYSTSSARCLEITAKPGIARITGDKTNLAYSVRLVKDT